MPDPTPDPIFDKPAVDRPTHPATLDDDALLAACSWKRSKGGGPGGQHRNKVETTIELTHTATGISAKAGERRSIRENRSVALKRLRLELALGYRVGVPAGECRSELWRSRTRDGRLVISPRHRDFPSLLAEALDVIAACDHDLAAAATRLVCSRSQILRLLRHHPPALAKLNADRAAHGRYRLK